MTCKCGNEIVGDFKSCESCRNKRAAAARRYSANKRSKGLCSVCSKEALPGKRCCADHEGRTAEYGDKNVDAGLCRFCGKRPPVTDLVSCQECRDYRKELDLAVKLAAFDRYGGRECACCRESNVEFLTIDHINGGGTQHRRSGKIVNIYRWLKKQNYPVGYRVLCFNCNAAYGLFGYCPHQKEKP